MLDSTDFQISTFSINMFLAIYSWQKLSFHSMQHTLDLLLFIYLFLTFLQTLKLQTLGKLSKNLYLFIIYYSILVLIFYHLFFSKMNEQDPIKNSREWTPKLVGKTIVSSQNEDKLQKLVSQLNFKLLISIIKHKPFEPLLMRLIFIFSFYFTIVGRLTYSRVLSSKTLPDSATWCAHDPRLQT